MTRPRKQTVDYFPHQCHHGETIFILENRYGNDGYAFWFKILELLGTTEGHALDCKKPTTLNYLAAKTLFDKDKVLEILDLLSELDAIDSELWCKQKIVWSENFIKGISFAYKKREGDTPGKPIFGCKKSRINGVSDTGNPQRKVKESKGKKRKEIPPKPPKGGEQGFDIFWKAYPKKVGKGDALKKWGMLHRSTKLPSLNDILAAIEEQKTWDQWQKDGGQYIPNPATWLNQGRWEDEKPEEVKPEWMRNLSEK